MPTPTISRPAPGAGRTRRHQPAQHGRFSRHREPEPSRMSKMMSSVTDAMPSMSSSSQKRRAKRKSPAGRTSKGKRAGGMALLAGGVGLAMKNRDKLMGMMGRREHHGEHSPPAPPRTMS